MKDESICRKADAREKSEGVRHGQIHPQVEEHYHGHYHGQICAHVELDEPNPEHPRLENQHHGSRREKPSATLLTIRSYTGISGDILLCGLSVLHLIKQGIDPASPAGDAACNDLCHAIMPQLEGSLIIRTHLVNGVGGWQAEVNLPRTHEHRHLEDIRKILECSNISTEAKKRAGLCFEMLAMCEASVHGVEPGEAHFHEVGALDSILDICGTCELYEKLGCPPISSSPLPVADGEVNCAHGLVPAPAPATLKLLENIPVRPFVGSANAGELVTPTGIALLRALGARFGKWPTFAISATALVYGHREFADSPNGVIFAVGHPWQCTP